MEGSWAMILATSPVIFDAPMPSPPVLTNVILSVFDRGQPQLWQVREEN